MVVLAIALNTFKETIRDKILYTMLLFGLGFAIVGVLVSEWSLGQQEKVLQDFGLFIITAFGLLISIFIGTGLLFKELDKRTIYAIISKPISRSTFILGKYFGLLLTLFLVFLIMTAGILILLYLFTLQFKANLLTAIVFSFLQMSIMVGLAILFSLFMSPIVSSILALFVFVAGNFAADLKVLGPGTENPVLEILLNILYYIVPNFQLLNYQTEVVHNLTIESSKVLLGLAYVSAYCVVLLLTSSLLFKKTNLK